MRVPAIIVANLCVCYIMSNHNQEVRLFGQSNREDFTTYDLKIIN